MRMANQAIKRERHPMPTVEDLIHKLNGATVFSKLDLRSGYHQLTPVQYYVVCKLRLIGAGCHTVHTVEGGYPALAPPP